MNKHFQEALNLAQGGQIDLALKKCNYFIKKKPNNCDFLLLAASLYAQTNQYEQVKNYCLRASKLKPKDTNILYNLSVAYLFLEDYKNAIKYTQFLLKIEPNHANANANIGLAYWKIGDLENAKKYASKANKLDPQIATNNNNLGLINKSLGDITSAEKYFKKAINLNPNLAEAFYNYGITLLDTKNKNGEHYIDKALDINPEYPEANNQKGLQLFNAENITQAIIHLKKAISSKPDYAEAYCNLGNAYMEEKKYTDAEAMYRKAIEHNPKYASAYNNLGNALLDQDDYQKHQSEATQCYLKAIELSPELDDTFKNLAICYQGEGSQDKALKYFEIYNSRVPNDEVVIAGMSSVHERRGEFNEGMSLIEPYIKSEKKCAEIILAYAKLAKHFKVVDEAILALNSINDNEISNKLQIEKYYALGKLSAPLGNIDETFKYYKRANDLEEDKFDIDLERKKFNNIKSYFSKHKIQSLPLSNCESRLPIFIIGMPRSGTSLAEQILASHPDVYGAGELEDIHHITQKIARKLEPKENYPLCLDSIDSNFATEIANSHINKLQQKSPKSKYIVDKMPHNFMGLGLINILFPKATIIQCKRSSVDITLSIYFQHFNKHHAYANSLKLLGQYYNLYADLMEHWKAVLDLNIIELEYEKVIENPEEEIRKLLSQCSIDWNPACLKFHENKRTVNTPSYDQVRQPIYKSSVAKWKKYEQYLDDLIHNLGSRAY